MNVTERYVRAICNSGLKSKTLLFGFKGHLKLCCVGILGRAHGLTLEGAVRI